MSFIRSYLPIWAGGVSESQLAKTSLQKFSGTGSSIAENNKSLAQLAQVLDKAQLDLIGWINTFQVAQNQIKLPDDMSPIAKSIIKDTKTDTKAEVAPTKNDTKIDEKVTVAKSVATQNKESIWHLPDTRIKSILDRTIEEIKSDHGVLLKLTNQSLSFYKPTDKDREVKMSQLAIIVARKLRDMIDDVRIVITECLLDEEIGVKLVRAAPALISLPVAIVASVLSDAIIQQAKELGDQLLKKHIQKSIDQIQDYLNKFLLDCMKVSREMHKCIDEINKKPEIVTPDRPDNHSLRLTIPSSNSL